MTELRRDWANKMHMALGYLPVEDDEQLRAFNACIKGIIQSERQKREAKGLPANAFSKLSIIE